MYTEGSREKESEGCLKDIGLDLSSCWRGDLERVEDVGNVETNRRGDVCDSPTMLPCRDAARCGLLVELL